MKKYIFSLCSTCLLFVLIASGANAQTTKKDNTDITIDGEKNFGLTCNGNLTSVTINVGVKYTSKDNNYHIVLSKINKGTKTDTTIILRKKDIDTNIVNIEKNFSTVTDVARVIKLTGVRILTKKDSSAKLKIINENLSPQFKERSIESDKIESITIRTNWIFKNKATNILTFNKIVGVYTFTKIDSIKVDTVFTVKFNSADIKDVEFTKNGQIQDELKIPLKNYVEFIRIETIQRKQVKNSITEEKFFIFSKGDIRNGRNLEGEFSIKTHKGDEVLTDTTVIAETKWDKGILKSFTKSILDKINIFKKSLDTASFDMKGPLNFLVLDELFREKSKEVLDNDCPLSNASIHEVFLWLYTINNETPTIGTLRINSSICVLTNEDEDKEILKNYVVRSEVLATYEETLKSYEKETGLSFIDKKRVYDGLAGDMSAGSYIAKIKEVSLQFERGFLERIQVWAENKNGKLVIYENIFAVGFSSIKNIRDLQEVKLFSRESNKEYQKFILLSDVFSNYDNLLDNYTRDYSPADTALNNISAGALVVLKKETFFNLFDSRIFSDLSGMDEESPNGLVQIEASRRFNMITSRHQFGNNIRADYGFLNYINIYGSFNKIEKDSKYLPLQNRGVSDHGVLVSPSYATNLDFRRYENASLGIEWGIFLWDWPDGKFTTYIDFGLKYGHTPLKDSSRVHDKNKDIFKGTNDLIDLDGHTLTLYPRISTEFFAEKRVGLLIGYQFNNAFLFSNNLFKQVKSYAKSDLATLPIEKGARQYHMLEFFLRAQASKEGKMFLRARFFFQQGDANTFFPQFQLGYAYNIFFRK